MRLSWQLCNLHFWLKFFVGLIVISIFLTSAQVFLSPYQNFFLKFDGQIGDFYVDQVIADHDITSTSTLVATPNCVLVPSMAGSLNCISDSGAVRWQTILTDTLSGAPIYIPTQKTLLLTQQGGGLLMVSEKTGDIIWQFKDLQEFNWKQSFISQNQQFAALLNTRNQVFVFEISTGNLLWKTPENTAAPIEPKTRIFIHEDKIFIADSAAYTLTCLSFKTGAQIWRQQSFTGDTVAHLEFAGGLVWYPTNFYTWHGVLPDTGVVKAKISPPAGSIVTNTSSSLLFHNYGNQLFWFDAQTGAILETTQLPAKVQKIWFNQQLFVKMATAPFKENLSVIDVSQRIILWTSEPLQIIKDFMVLDEDNLATISLDGRVTWLALKTGKVISQLKTQETPLVLMKQQGTTTGLWLVTTHHGTYSSAKELVDVWFFEAPGKLSLHHSDLPIIGSTSLVKTDRLWFVNLSQSSAISVTSKPLQHDLRFWSRSTQASHSLSDDISTIFGKYSEKETQENKQMHLDTVLQENFQGCLITTTITPSSAHFKKIMRQSSFNPWHDVTVTTKLKKNSESIATVTGFYFLPEAWRTILVAPELSQPETLTLETRLEAAGNTLTEETTILIPAGCAPNFINVSQDKKYLQTPTNEYYWGMGIQDVMLDANSDGSVFNDWQFGLTDQPNFNSELDRQDFRTYLKTFRQAGFSLFRISQDNFSFKNWLSFQSTTFRASLHTGLITDEFLKQLRTENYRVVFGIFGFEPETKSEAVAAYLDYCIARFGPWIDIWEISNEAWPDEKWVLFISDYLKKHDPHHHPVTTSWDRSNLPNIDIVNLHYYRTEPTRELTAEFLNQVFTNQTTHKPILFGEFGNSETNWDPDSHERLRIKSWLSAWQRTPLIIWNQSGSASTKKENSNLYMGPKEREVTKNLVSWFGKYEGIRLQPFPLASKTGNFCSGLTNNESLILIYCTNSSGVSRTELFEPSTVFTAANIAISDQKWKITWSDPKTLLEKSHSSFSASKNEAITSPAFSTDLLSEWRFDQ